MSAANALKAKFESGDATVAVIGQGYVGLPLSMELVAAGFNVIGVDVNEARVGELNAGESYIFDISNDDLSAAIATGRFKATTDYTALANVDAVSICVPTPLRKTRDPDISYIQAAALKMVDYLEGPVLVVLESTTYPGTTNEVLVPMLEKKNLTLDTDLFVAFSQERVDPGNEKYGLKNTPKVIGGVTKTSTDLAATFYGRVVDNVHPVGSAQEAELVKLLENTFRAVNIALVNEMNMMCDRMDIDIWRVIEAAATKPFGYMPFYPGPGIGGHCIPLDPTYLSWKAKSFGFYNRFIELATDINGNMPRHVVNKLVRTLNQRGKALKDANVLILGVAYKSDINDTRESPAIDMWKLLEDEWDANVSYHDPHIEEMKMFDAKSVPLSTETLANADVVLIATKHDNVDYDLVIKHADLILDTRNALKVESDHIVKL